MLLTELIGKAVKHLRDSTFPQVLVAWIRQYFGVRYEVSVVKKEARVVLWRLERGAVDTVVLVYDNSCSPPAYCNFTEPLMLGRYFQSIHLRVVFFVLTDGFREDWQPLGSEGKQRFISEQVGIASRFLGQRSDEVIVGSLDDLAKFVERGGGRLLVPFEDLVFNRLGIYYPCKMLIPMLYHHNTGNNAFFLSKAISPSLAIPEKPYIAWHVRAAAGWSLEHNISEEEFVYQCRKFRSCVADSTAVVILTNNGGYEFLKPIAVRHKLGVSFSKDVYRTTFIDDAAISIASSLFVQLGGGGLFAIPEYSLTPYYVTLGSHGSAQLEWFRQFDGGIGPKEGKLKPWSTPFQIIENDTEPNWSSLGLLIKELNL